jgi:hypothetical protein
MYKLRGSTTQAFINLMALVFTVLLVVKLFPVYYDHYAVRTSLENVVVEINKDNLALAEVKKSVRKRFEVNNISPDLADQLKFVKDKETPYLTLDYEIREHLFMNVSILLNFHLDYEISYDGEVKATD